MLKAQLYEDRVREGKKTEFRNRYSPYSDLIYYESSVTPGLRLAMQVQKPKTKGHIIATTHGWHMTLPEFDPNFVPADDSPYLWVHVDMRGRAYSTGRPDANGLELFDVLDAVEYVKLHYADYLIDTDTVYFEGGSGGGGNAFALAGKFPDYFAAVTALCGISDYAHWYDNDLVGEFKDELDPWVGKTPAQDPMAYSARSGAAFVENLMAPLYTAHGETDERVPVFHARNFVEKANAAGRGALVTYDELPGVGTQGHWGRATPEQMDMVAAHSEANRLRAPKPPVLPESGELWVPGYLVTRRFRVMLDSPDKLARLRYDLPKGEFALSCPVPCGWTVEVFA